MADLEEFLALYSDFFEKQKIGVEELGGAYLHIVDEMVRARLEFVRLGKYPSDALEKVFDQVYGDRDYMTQYMLGLALSQFLWEHHHKVYSFFIHSLSEHKHAKKILEVGPGHGLFMARLLGAVSHPKKVDVIDISETSLDITRSLLDSVSPFSNKINYILGDAGSGVLDRDYDFIIMGEVLEHVEDPFTLLLNINRVLADNGTFFVSTCSNCPAVDHIYYFKDVEEIRHLIHEAGFVVKKEVCAPASKASREKIEKFKVDVIYAGFLQKEKGK